MEQTTDPTLPAMPVSLSKFCDHMGIAPATAWRWRKRGILRTSNIAGRQYLTPAALAEFYQNMEAGKFAKAQIVPPAPNRAAAR